MLKLKEKGFKLTPQRLAILKFLDNTTSHPSAEDIHKSLSKKFPTMSLATVYNFLNVLQECEEVRKLTIDPDKKRFDSKIHPHHHLICLRCKRIVDIEHDFPLKLPSRQKMGFKVVSNHIEFSGFCPECKNKK